MHELAPPAHPLRSMTRICVFGLLGLLATASHSSQVSAADPAEDKIILMQSSSDGLIADLEYMVNELAKKKKQWANNIQPNIELFLDGVDREKPIRVDAMFDEKQGEYYRPYFPIVDLALFRNNLDALGITSRPVARNLFQLEQAFNGHMRVLSDYAVFAPTEWKEIIPDDLTSPEVEIENIVAPTYDAAVKIENSADRIQARHDSLKAVRANSLAEVKKKSTESAEEFELRQILAENQLAKLSNLYAELKYLEAGWTTDSEKNEGRGKLIMEALEGTPLAESFNRIPNLETRFHGLKQVDNFVATGRITIPVSPRGQERLQRTYDAYHPVIDQKIDNHESMDASQKKASKEAVNKVIALLEKNLEMGQFDSFVQMRKGKKKNTHEAIFGVQMTDGKQVDEIVKLLPKVYSRYVLKADVAQAGAFAIHHIKLEDEVPPMLESLFGAPLDVYVGTSENILLVAFGSNSLEWLKQVAGELETSEPTTSPLFLTFKGQMGPFANALTALKPNENRPKLREMIVEAFTQGDDYIEMSDTFKDGQVHGEVKVEPGLLRFLGLAVAKFAEENL